MGSSGGKALPVFSWPLDNQASLELILGESYDFPQNETVLYDFPGKQSQLKRRVVPGEMGGGQLCSGGGAGRGRGCPANVPCRRTPGRL